ncbi:MAG: DJ-1/PfpI family protein [Firmicutes bacterium]|nr:DJ-1/PfpI family protein [Bacillota bacterium]
MNYYCLLFDRFESLDLFGPVEVLGKAPRANLHYVSMTGGIITGADSVRVDTERVDVLPPGSVFLIPGGMGTRSLVEDSVFLEKLGALVDSSSVVLSVCTGSALLAASGALEGKRATSNKRAFEWVTGTGDADWVGRARWVKDGKFYTASGVSAGIDMALAFVEDTYGREIAEDIAELIEYVRNDDPKEDPFAR